MAASHHDWNVIRFEGELLPCWAQLLDLGARLIPVSDEVRKWFCRFTASPGVEDARTVIEQCRSLRSGIQQHRESLVHELGWDYGDGEPSRILGAWLYSLDTMIERAENATTCRWSVEGAESIEWDDDSEGGDISLRRG